MAVERPLIGVTGPSRGALGPRACIALGVCLAGGRPVQLSPRRPRGKQVLHGVVISGGHDIDPVLYAEAAAVESRLDPERDAYESEAIDEALSEDLPVLGICRGAQLLNVRLGGSLHQELRSQRRHTSNRRTLLPLKTLILEDGTRLRGLLGVERARINSLHSQGIARVGRGLRVAGRDLDGIVQAVEQPGHHFVIGVQWHPEFLLYLRRQRAIFRALVDHARTRVVP